MPNGKAHFGTLTYFSKARQNWMDAPNFLGLHRLMKELRADPCSKQKLVHVSYLSTSKSALYCFTEHKNNIPRELVVLLSNGCDKGKINKERM